MNTYDKNIHILGSNFSCYKNYIAYIHGFDEEIVYYNKDDVDLELRFIMSGCKMKSCKFCANLFYLGHSRNDRLEEAKTAKE